MMYGPAADGFLQWAREHGAVGSDGLGMLVEQAAEAFLIWRGVRPPSEQVPANCARSCSMKAVLRWMALVLLAFAALQLFLAAHRDDGVGRSAVHHLPALGSVAHRHREAPAALAAALAAYEGFPTTSSAVIAAEDGSFRQPRRRGLGRDREGLGAQRQGGGTGGARAALAPRARQAGQDRGRLHHHAAAREEPALRRAHDAAQGPGTGAHLALENLLTKQRILEIYLNNVEWGEGVFGVEAAAQHYFRKSASRLVAYEAARLAVMLPQPKRFEDAGFSYLAGRTSTIVARMRDAELP